ncbi:MAG: hypothetical protein J7L62_01250 [Candidatus Aminicenantes bacterium]|nr:hypothetical protein [Candidatus Aminicenantes bacterium]
MKLPFGEIENGILKMKFSSADYSVATVIAGIREHLDVLEEMGVEFLGIETEIVTGPRITFTPVPVVAFFRCISDNCEEKLLKAYKMVWKGIVLNFPDEIEWAEAKSYFANFVSSQADLLLARVEAEKEE